MFRLLIVPTLALLVMLAMDVRPCHAAVISRNNPYRSFNISGVNYGSMQWERKHSQKASKSWSGGRTGGRWFRRR